MRDGRWWRVRGIRPWLCDVVALSPRPLIPHHRRPREDLLMFAVGTSGEGCTRIERE